MNPARAAVFVDRDGTIIEDTNYIRDPNEVRLIPGATDALKLISEKGYLIFVISNQSGVGRGIIKDDEFWSVHCRFCELLEKENVRIAQFLYCLHHPHDNCPCRKPRAGLIPKKFEGTPLALEKCFSVGDKEIDALLADSIGATGCLVLTGKGRQEYEKLQEQGHSRYDIYEDLGRFAEHLPVIAEKI